MQVGRISNETANKISSWRIPVAKNIYTEYEGRYKVTRKIQGGSGPGW